MRRIVWSVVLLGLIIGANWGIAKLFNGHFLDWSFLTGLAVTVFIGFFNSSGGFTSDLADSRLQSTNNDGQWAATEVRTKIDRQKLSFQATPLFYVALSYTIVTGILTFIYYMDFIF